MEIPRNPENPGEPQETPIEMTDEQAVCVHAWIVTGRTGRCDSCGLELPLQTILRLVERDAADEEALHPGWSAEEERQYEHARREDERREYRSGMPLSLVEVRRPSSFTDVGVERAKKRFLEAYREYGTVRAGARAAQVSRDTVQKWYGTDAKFQAAYDDARMDYGDRLVEEVDRRAVVGTVKHVKKFDKGVLVDEWDEIQHSDLLLMFLTKAHRPEFRDRVQQQDTGAKLTLKELQEMLGTSPQPAAVSPGKRAEDAVGTEWVNPKTRSRFEGTQDETIEDEVEEVDYQFADAPVNEG